MDEFVEWANNEGMYCLKEKCTGWVYTPSDRLLKCSCGKATAENHPDYVHDPNIPSEEEQAEMERESQEAENQWLKENNITREQYSKFTSKDFDRLGFTQVI